MGRRLTTTPAEDPEHRIATLVDAHGAALLRVARHHSLCLDDAQDAYQRALEIYLRRIETVDPATEGAWMKVVVRHEAMAVRRARSGSVSGEEVDFDARVDDGVPQLEDRLARAERSARSAEVLRRLKPDEAKALLLKAEGHSYGEIGEQQGWTYTNACRRIDPLGGKALAGSPAPCSFPEPHSSQRRPLPPAPSTGCPQHAGSSRPPPKCELLRDWRR